MWLRGAWPQRRGLTMACRGRGSVHDSRRPAPTPPALLKVGRWPGSCTLLQRVTRMRALLAVAAVAVFTACAQQSAAVAEGASRDELAESESPGLASSWASATPRQRCYVQVFEEYDLDGRACMVPCILEGRGAMIGGGCWHICYSRTELYQPSSTTFSGCPPPEPTPPPAPPSIVCSRDPAGRVLRIALVDAAANGPITAAQITVAPLDERLVTDETGQAQVLDPPTGRLEIYVFARRYFSHSASLIVPGLSRCDVRFELATTRGHGF